MSGHGNQGQGVGHVAFRPLLEELDQLVAGDPYLRRAVEDAIAKVYAQHPIQPKTLAYQLRGLEKEIDIYVGTELTYMERGALSPRVPPKLHDADVQIFELARKMTLGPNDIMILELRNSREEIPVSIVDAIGSILGKNADRTVFLHTGDYDVQTMTESCARRLQAALKKRFGER